MDLTLLAVFGVLVIVAVSVVSSKVGVAAPLSLVVVGVLVSFVPGVPPVDLEPEIILAGVLPPLLYSASVNMPIIDFRRDLRAISGLSVFLVLASAALMGWLAPMVVPGIGFAEGFALGAIVSPTDAVATSIVRHTGVAPRIATVLDGESLLNDASALVLLRTAVAAAGVATSVSFVDVGLDFLRTVLVAIVMGFVVAAISLAVRAFVNDATIATALSFVVPFLAYAPAEALGGSGLVATVVAGLGIGYRGIVELRPEDRLAEKVNWRTIAFLLEGGVFLVLGLELRPLLDRFDDSGEPVSRVVVLTAMVFGLLLVARSVYVAFVMLGLRRSLRESERRAPRLVTFKEYLRSPEAQKVSERRRERAWRRVKRYEADIEFYTEQKLKPREGIVLVWAGMRGAVTVAAAQSLPQGFAERDLIVLTAFCVAVLSLLLQGGTLAWVVRRLGVEADLTTEHRQQIVALSEVLLEVTIECCDDVAESGLDGEPIDQVVIDQVRRRSTPKNEWDWAGEEGPQRDQRVKDLIRLRRAVIDEQRAALLEVRSEGRYDSAVVGTMLDRLDAVEFASAVRSEQ